MPPPLQLFPAQMHKFTCWKPGSVSLNVDPHVAESSDAPVSVGVTTAMPKPPRRLVPGPEEAFVTCTANTAEVFVHELSVKPIVADRLAP